ncbi:MAG: hypothetical protein AB7G15_07810 [Alphaproteobacteria bacterium]
MALNIDTFSNIRGGNPFYSAIVHPRAAAGAAKLVARLRKAKSLAVYDPHGLAESFDQVHRFAAAPAVYVQDIQALERVVLGARVQPITNLAASAADLLFVAAFDAGRLTAHLRHLLPRECAVATLDDMRLPNDALTEPARYLDPINFVVNFAFFRDAGGRHTRVSTANYWSGYGAAAPHLYACLFGGDGAVLAEWTEKLPDAMGGVVIDSDAVRRRFGLGPFTGQLFLHVIGAAGHPIVKYALDTYGDDPTILSCTHDANAWPADRYAGLPAPLAGEKIVLWLQNSHPSVIPAGGIGLNPMGSDETAWLQTGIAPFATHALDVSTLLPNARWPQQIEIRAGKHCVRPRYEITAANGRTRIAHVNVERDDLASDPRIAEMGELLGKGYILPAPVLPIDRFRTELLPTPMATAQADLPLAVIVYDAAGNEIKRHRLGRLRRADCQWLDVTRLIGADGFGRAGESPGGYGHLELVYDFADGGGADGWAHAIFRYQDRETGHVAETSFGAHIFNTVLTYRHEPQSYAGPAPGLSTRLFLRLAPAPAETLCHLIYPASTPWHAESATDLILHDHTGAAIARRRVAIPCNGSLLWRVSELFDDAERVKAGRDAHILVRDHTCRLFGYHGIEHPGAAFSLDHMFGF